MNTCQTSIKYRYIIVVMLKPPSWVNQANTRPLQLVPSELIKGGVSQDDKY